MHRLLPLSTVLLCLAILQPVRALGEEATKPAPIARWLFDEGKGDVASDGSDGKTNGKVVRAEWTDGRAGKALAFEDYSLRNYLKPDVREATRVVVPHDDRLNPSGPFTLRAVVFPTKDPVYYGGIFEKGHGYGASYRLLVLRGLKVRATAGPAQTAVTSKDPLALNEWHVLELAYDGSSLTLRVDGKEQGRAEGVKGPFANREEALIGERFSGKIDEVSLTAP